jgi:20S proteasome subunit alpha 2
VDEKTINKTQLITKNIGITYSGMGPDFRVLVTKARKAAQRYKLTYKDDIPVSQLVTAMASVMQEFTQSGGVRPFGVSLLVAGCDDEGPQLHQVDPSGSAWAWKASSIGKHSINAKTFLEKRYEAYDQKAPELEDAIHIAILTLKEGFEGAIDENNIEIGIVGEDKLFRVLTPAEVKDYLNEVE